MYISTSCSSHLESILHNITLLVLMFVSMFVSNKRHNGLTDWAQILCDTSSDPRECLLMLTFLKVVSKFFDFRKILNFHKQYYEICELAHFYFVLLQREDTRR